MLTIPLVAFSQRNYIALVTSLNNNAILLSEIKAMSSAHRSEVMGGHESPQGDL